MLSIRKIGVFGRTYRHLNRYRQILGVLFKYGFDDLIDRLKIEQYIEIGLQMISKKRRERVEKLARSERVRLAFEELGSTYIKLGQMLSTRPDLIPGDFIKELSKLQDRVPPFPFREVKAIIEKEFDRPLQEIFVFFDEIPIASASIGQVHKAGLKDGDIVAVKVQRPGIRQRIEVDLEIMLHLAMLMERHIEDVALHRPTKIVEEFARTIEKETDYTSEAANIERFARNFLDDATLYVPRVYHERSTPRVLTMEFVDGIKVSEIDRLEASGMDMKVITARGADLILKQVFDHGFFHADPHPGNIFVLPGNLICLLDFGMAGSVDLKTREDFVDLVDAVVKRDEYRTTQVLLKFTSWDAEPEVRLLEKEVAEFMGKHLYKPLKDIKLGHLIQNLFELISHHRLRIPPDIFLVMKALTTVEGVALKLDPEFDMISQSAPFIRRVKLARMYPDRIAAEVLKLAEELLHFGRQFPKDLLEVLRMIKQRKLSVKMKHQGMENMLATHDQISNRISFAIIIAALIVGSALIVISKTPPFVFGISLIGMVGFLAAAVMGIWLLIAILKKGRL